MNFRDLCWIAVAVVFSLLWVPPAAGAVHVELDEGSQESTALFALFEDFGDFFSDLLERLVAPSDGDGGDPSPPPPPPDGTDGGGMHIDPNGRVPF